MSIALRNAVRDHVRDVKGAAKSVLLALADYANDEGGCWPSMGRMADEIGVTRVTVVRAVQTLEAAGYVKVESQRGRGNTNAYQINVSRVYTPALNDTFSSTPQNVSPRSENVSQCSENVSESNEKCITTIHEPSVNHQINHQEPHNAGAGAREAEPQPPLAQARAVIGPLLANGTYPDFAAFWTALLTVYPATGKKNLSAVKQWARQRIEPGEWSEIVECAKDYAQSAVVVDRGAVASLERFLTESNWLAYGAELPPVAKGAYTNGNGTGHHAKPDFVANDRNARGNRAVEDWVRTKQSVLAPRHDIQELPPRKPGSP